MTQSHKFHNTINNQFTTASVNINKYKEYFIFKVEYSIIEDVTKFIQRRFSGVVITKQTSTMIEGYFDGIK